MTIYGASSAEWDAFRTLKSTDILPFLADPSTPMSKTSSISIKTKAPGVVRQGKGGGFLNWSTRITSDTDIAEWRVDPRHGICLVTRDIRAIDIDIDDPTLAAAVSESIRDSLGLGGSLMPARTRPNSGKHTLLYRISDMPDPLTKYVVDIAGDANIVEFLFDKQQTYVAGMHKSGVRYEWLEGIPTYDAIPVFTMDEVREMIRQLIAKHARPGFNREWKENKVFIRKSVTGKVDPNNDPAVQYMYDRDLVLGECDDGAYFVRCPWQFPNEDTKGHTPDTTMPDAAKYYPAGMNRDDPGFKCLHASCDGKDHRHFLDAIGYESHLFPMLEDIPEAALTRPNMSTKGRNGRVEPNLDNVVSMLRWSAGTGLYLTYDLFRDVVLYRMGDHWQELTDDAYTAIRLRLTKYGMDQSLPKHLIPDAVSFVARESTIDSGEEWLKAQRWDGTPRLEHFHTTVLKLDDTPYHQAVCLYMWTALAGRLLEPGTKADMVPILVGPQGLRKSTLVEVIAPTPNEHTTISLADRDDNLSRQLRGKMIAEWDELRGLNSRDADGIKAWVTHNSDEWIPKFKEFGTKRLRRFLPVGTHNEKRFLNDPTGARRWLPLVLQQVIDIDYVVKYREELWAEAAFMWAQKKRTNASGVYWEDAERLAFSAQKAATVRDIWVDPVGTWLAEQGKDGWSSAQVLNMAVGVPTAQANRALQERVRRVLIFLGWEEDDDGRWFFTLA